ncbi:MAG: polysaccharide deacetylase family protein [Candidatus Hydrogenedentota bacterium]
MSMGRLSAYISIHDVMPSTLGYVREIVEELEEYNLGSVMLLVTSGRQWAEADIAELHRLAAKGYVLAGHGWTHKAENVTGWRHRLYSAVISRRAAEHLDLTEPAIAALIEQSYRWFEANGFQPPTLYVPPAWALGPISRQALRNLPYRWYETLTGLYDARSARCWRLPLVGYEADTRTRVMALRALNGVNFALCRVLRRPVRVAIHPRDFKLRLASNLRRTLQSGFQSETLGGSLASATRALEFRDKA